MRTEPGQIFIPRGVDLEHIVQIAKGRGFHSYGSWRIDTDVFIDTFKYFIKHISFDLE